MATTPRIPAIEVNRLDGIDPTAAARLITLFANTRERFQRLEGLVTAMQAQLGANSQVQAIAALQAQVARMQAVVNQLAAQAAGGTPSDSDADPGAFGLQADFSEALKALDALAMEPSPSHVAELAELTKRVEALEQGTAP